MKQNKLYNLFLLAIFLCLTTFSMAQQLGKWISLNSLPSPRSDCAAVVVNTTIYVLGGYAYTTTPYPVLRTTIKPDGSLTSWVQESTQMIVPRTACVAVYSNGYIYAISGGAILTAGDNTTAERAQINPDGSLGVWSTISILPKEFVRSAWVQTTAFVYLLGGYSGTTDVWRVSLNPDGTMVTWQLMSSHFDIQRYGAQAALVDNYIFLNGGTDLLTVTDTGTTLRALLYPDGNLGPWTIINRPNGHYSGMAAYVGSYFYLIGGSLVGDPNYHTEKMHIKPDYSLDTEEPGPNLNNDRQDFAYVQTPKGIYVIGGWAGSDMSSVEYAPILGFTGIERKQWEIFE